jgi:hypothetical protein
MICLGCKIASRDADAPLDDELRENAQFCGACALRAKQVVVRWSTTTGVIAKWPSPLACEEVVN